MPPTSGGSNVIWVEAPPRSSPPNSAGAVSPKMWRSAIQLKRPSYSPESVRASSAGKNAKRVWLSTEARTEFHIGRCLLAESRRMPAVA